MASKRISSLRYFWPKLTQSLRTATTTSLSVTSTNPTPSLSAAAGIPRSIFRARSISSLSSSSSSSLHNDGIDTICSQRALEAVQLLPSYLADARSVPTYDATTCPNGALQLGVAESKMLADWLVPALADMPSLTEDAIYYQPTAGQTQLRTVMAAYMQDLLVPTPQQTIDPDGIVVGAGCNAVLENLCFCVANAGDAVLIPTPYYAAFEFDLAARAQLVVQHVECERHYHAGYENDDVRRYYPTVKALDAAHQAATARGARPQILLLSHPHNPLGICYPPHVLQACIEWSRQHQVHLIADEIYAGSVYRPHQGAGFASILQVAADNTADRNHTSTPAAAAAAGLGLGPYIHWVYALSKDFGLSGMRVGVAYSENKDVRVPLQKLNDLCQMSSQAQAWTAHLLSKKLDNGRGWVEAFRAVNHERLERRASRLEQVLDQAGIPYLEPTAGLFLWMDLRRYLPARNDVTDDNARERELYRQLVHHVGILMTPGMAMRNHVPGFFRCVFTAAASDAEFDVALQRLGNLDDRLAR